MLLFSLCLAKLLVTTGKGNSDTEIIDLLNPNSICKNWANYPYDVFAAVGQIVDSYPFICGGFDDDEFHQECYKITNNSVVSLPNANLRSHSSAGVFKDTLFIAGGYGKIGDGYGLLSSTDYISESSLESRTDTPMIVFGHCVININDNEILLTGGTDIIAGFR